MRYVLIEFDDDTQAEALVKKINDANNPKYRIAGMFQEPKTYCPCPLTDQYHKNQVVQGVKYGWWVHTICKKPRKGGQQLKNLISIRDRKYHKEEGYVYYSPTLSVMDIPRQNIVTPKSTE